MAALLSWIIASILAIGASTGTPLPPVPVISPNTTIAPSIAASALVIPETKTTVKVETPVEKKVIPVKTTPTALTPTVTRAQPTSSCNPNYSGCLKSGAGDYDCASGSGNGPNYTGKVQVLGHDEFGLDRDGDGIGCE